MRTLYIKVHVDWEDCDDISDELLLEDLIGNIKSMALSGISFELDIPRSEEFKKRVEVASQYYSLIAQGKTSETDEHVVEIRRQLDELEDRFSDDAGFVGMLRSERKIAKLAKEHHSQIIDDFMALGSEDKYQKVLDRMTRNC